MPEAQPLALLRRDIDRRPEKLKTVLTDPTMRKLILNGITKDEKKAVKAFADQNRENMLKTKPKVRSPPLIADTEGLRPEAWNSPGDVSIVQEFLIAKPGPPHQRELCTRMHVRYSRSLHRRQIEIIKVLNVHHKVYMQRRGRPQSQSGAG